MRIVLVFLALLLGAYTVQAATPDDESPFEQQEEDEDDRPDDDDDFGALAEHLAPLQIGFVTPFHDEQLAPEDIYPSPLHRPPAA